MQELNLKTINIHKSSGFSEKIAREVALKPHLNIGVFALELEAPHWQVWQKNLKKALSSGKIWGAKEFISKITIYNDNEILILNKPSGIAV